MKFWLDLSEKGRKQTRNNAFEAATAQLSTFSVYSQNKNILFDTNFSLF